ncbi:ATP-binding protein [Mucilaginibacter sp. L3T2-6]|uniref:hybrid sensor histidine kinase/response regulator n=1 Tax=Mucilaginibacter sp. L3T2-6 TaxID=3062491 RepID=UPI0026771435|nr:ATP-binding protein [Mucilaginibacter sp. L3T2-6]MDO3643183.1 ATP-binding protein [Mucilaginibacter sp. L3T2-6]MDV6215507.1 ATP-binding protein [Mucilaginibacter sp. L3T2-6]
MHKKTFIRSVKGKIIIAATLACLALFLAWSTSKDAFTAMLTAFENISAPNDKLRLVNDLSRGIARIDQVQRARSVSNPDKYYGFNDSKILSRKIDTLQSLYPQKSAQVRRLNTLKNLLEDRDRLFVSYVKVREGLIDNKSFSAQIDGLNDIVNQTAQQADSMATSTEKKTSTTTVYQGVTTAEKKDNRNFFQKLFGRKKAKDTDSLSKPFQIVAEELKVKHDTLAKAIQDSLLKGLSQTMRDLEKVQQQKSEAFVNRETVLIRSSERIMRQIFSILKKVEDEVVEQTAENTLAARKMVRGNIERIGTIILAFVVLAIFLVYFILRDISRINKYRKELEAAKEEAEYHSMAKQRFLSNMSHEIRTPLQSIIGYAEMVRQQEHPQKKDIEAIYSSSGHLMQIVNEVLDYNRIISGKFSFASQPFDMLELLNEAVAVMQLQADRKGLNFHTNFDPSVPNRVMGDPFRLKQILFNLLGNAIKFTEQGEVILSVTGKITSGHISYHFKVTDTGVGLTEDDIGRIFNEFEQAGHEDKARNGTGLGLPITKELIERQGGSMNVKSKPGKGSTFSFVLKFEKAGQPEIDIEKSHNSVEAGAKPKVWIIDDDRFILELCSRIFEQNKIEYSCFNSPHDLLHTVWDNAVKYLLMDIRMPEMSGTELCRLMRASIPADVKIYALTAQALPGERESVLAHGFNGLLMKPFRETDLVNLVGGDKTAETDKPVINIKAIEKMTFGDAEQTAKILASFARDSFNDEKEIAAAMEAGDMDKLLLVTHRVAGRTAQAGARDLAEDFRLAEIELSAGKELSQKRKDNILLLTQKLHRLAKAMQEYNVPEAVE